MYITDCITQGYLKIKNACKSICKKLFTRKRYVNMDEGDEYLDEEDHYVSPHSKFPTVSVTTYQDFSPPRL